MNYFIYPTFGGKLYGYNSMYRAKRRIKKSPKSELERIKEVKYIYKLFTYQCLKIRVLLHL